MGSVDVLCPPAVGKQLPKGMKIGAWNLRSIRNKFEELKLIMLQPDELDILCVTESHLKKEDKDADYEIKAEEKSPPLYNMLRRDRTNQDGGGGIIMYIRSEIPHFRREDLEQKQDYDDIECVWAEIKYPNSPGILVCAVYRAPDYSLNMFMERFEPIMETAFMENKELIVLGDFNMDYTNGFDDHQGWKLFIESFSLYQMINTPTRVTEESATIIDHIYTTEPSNIAAVMVPVIGTSDHYPVCYTRNSRGSVKNKHISIKYRSFKRFNEASFISDLENQPWHRVNQFEDPNEALEVFNTLLMEIVDKHMPEIEKRVKRQRQQEWMVPEILDMMHARDQFKRNRDEGNYKLYRNVCTTLIRDAKAEFYKRKLEEATTGQNVWKYLKELIPTSSMKDISMIRTDDGEITNPKDIANEFNNFFIEIAEKYIPHNPDGSDYDDSKLRAYIESIIPPDITFSIPDMDSQFICSELQHMKVNKATGLDGINAKVLRIAAPVIAEPLRYIYNLSIRSGIFPDIWKKARVTPIHKSKDITDRGNYRPVSILPLLSKLIERHIHNCFYKYLMDLRILIQSQSGFRKLHSCETALIKLIDTWVEALNRGELNGVIFIDLRKAFDLVNHEILLKKLAVYRCDENALKWFSSYLDNRTQCVRTNGELSSFRTIQSGVPQGSILGLLLFILFINDLPLHCNNSIDMFADDSTLHTQKRTVVELEHELNADLENISMWCKSNKMATNTAKTHSMLVTTWQKRIHLEKKDMDVTLQNSEAEKVLGVTIDQHLNWNQHVFTVHSKVSQALYVFRKIKSHLPYRYRIMFYNAFIQPHFDYCSIVWSTTSGFNMNRLLKLQKRAARLILECPWRTRSENMFKQLKWMPLADRIEFTKMTMVYKAKHQ